MKKRVFLLLIAITVCSLTAHLMFLWRSSIPQTPSRTTLAPARNIQNDSPQVKQGNPDLRKILHDYDKQFKEQPASKINPFGVHYSGKKFLGNMTEQDVLCRLKNTLPSTMTSNITPFKEMGISNYFPDKNIYEKYSYSHCAVVLSSFYMNETEFGDEIDAHEAVLRLNNAPTDRYEESVGRKTSIHLFNSKCFNKEAHINNTEAMFVNTTLVMWQTGPYNGNLYKWYQLKPVKLMLDKYIAWRKVFPSPDFYVIHPRSLWFAWDALEYFNKGNPIKKIVPSSGFTGLLMMLGLCDKVDVYGFGINDVSDCHYYDKPGCNNENMRWHPFQEKVLIAAMHDGPRSDLDRHVVTINGFKHIHCT